MTKEIPLSLQGKYKGKYVATVDDADYERVSKYRWAVTPAGKTHYARRWTYRKDGKQTTQAMHQFIMEGLGYFGPTDHKDGNGLNNTRLNLRPCTLSQNQMNRHRITGISRYKGVSWDRKNRKWQVHIKVNHHRTNLGRYASETDAAKVYDKKAQELFGEFACLNFPLQDK